MKHNKRTRAGSEKQYGPRLVGEILHDYLENSNEPFAVAYREHTAEAEEERDDDRLFEDVFPDTFLAVDLKLFSRQPGRMPVGECLSGVLARDGEDHFRFLENSAKWKRVVTRNPHVFIGECINVNKKDDGTQYPTFCKPRYSKDFTFKHFCLKAAEELLMVAGLLGE